MNDMKPFRLAFLALAAAAVLGSCAGRSVQQVSLLPDVQKIGNLEGSYSMKFTSDGETRYATASVKKIAERQYQIARVTVYGPTVYSFTAFPTVPTSNSRPSGSKRRISYASSPDNPRGGGPRDRL